MIGDPQRLLEEAGRRFYGGESAALPDAGAVTIDFDLGEEARALAAELDAFFRKNLTPELKAKAHYSWEGHDPGLHRKMAQERLLFLSWPKELGGRDAPPYARHAATVQFSAYLAEGRWLALARHANAMADRLAQQLTAVGLEPVWPVEANLVFVVLPRVLDARLKAAGANYYERSGEKLDVASDQVLVRLVTSFSTQDEDIQRFVGLCAGF